LFALALNIPVAGSVGLIMLYYKRNPQSTPAFNTSPVKTSLIQFLFLIEIQVKIQPWRYSPDFSGVSHQGEVWPGDG